MTDLIIPSYDNLRFEVILWCDTSIRFLDQTKLPHSVSYIDTTDYHEIISAIKSLAIRGAPLIGIAAAYGIALASVSFLETEIGQAKSGLSHICSEFESSRPTAVNLFWAVDQARKIISVADNSRTLSDSLIRLAIELHNDDKIRCDNIGEHGAVLFEQAGNIITHCNTGALATGGGGTALNVIATAFRKNKNIHVYVDETRPLLQGARLTTWELFQLEIPHTLITDSTAAFLMQQKNISAVIIGADRIAANGDTANKIGSYGLAVSARAHNIPFYLAAPISTIDISIPAGIKIVIEERNPSDIISINNTPIAPLNTKVYAPAFDITPHQLISAIITEKGILYPPFREKISTLFE